MSHAGAVLRSRNTGVHAGGHSDVPSGFVQGPLRLVACSTSGEVGDSGCRLQIWSCQRVAATPLSVKDNDVCGAGRARSLTRMATNLPRLQSVAQRNGSAEQPAFGSRPCAPEKMSLCDACELCLLSIFTSVLSGARGSTNARGNEAPACSSSTLGGHEQCKAATCACSTLPVLPSGACRCHCCSADFAC